MDRLDAMRAFVRVVELGSFSKVGVELRVKQSTVSKWVAALEERFGVQLIERTSRAQRVTEAGQVFYERARQILASYEDVEAQLMRSSVGLRGRLRVSVPVVFGQLFVASHAADFAAELPELELALIFDDRYVRLVDEGFDVAIRVGTPQDSSLLQRKLASTPRFVVAAPSYLARAGVPTTPQELRGHQCLSHIGLGARSVWPFVRGGRTIKVSVGGRLAANNSAAVRLMARRGLGVARLASWLVREDLERGDLVALLDDCQQPPAPIHALMPPSRHVHPRVRAFLDFVGQRLSADLSPGQ